MIQPSKETIATLLTLPRMAVPSYQRGYEWGGTEVNEFWDDLRSYDGKDSNSLFLGTVILHKDVEELRIVDGQQRLTTIFLLLIACRNRANELGAPTGQRTAFAIQNRIVNIDIGGRSHGCRLLTSESIRDVFEYIAVNDSWIGGDIPQILNGRSVKRQINRIKPVLDFFASQLKELDIDNLIKVVEAIEKIILLRIDINDELEAFKIFERTNARGVSLEATDLLKNYLFASLGSTIEGDWNLLIENSDSSFSRMLKYFYVSGHGPVQKSQLYRKLKLTGGDKKVLFDDLLRFSDFYRVMRTANRDALAEYLGSQGLSKISKSKERCKEFYLALEALRLFKITQAYPLIYSALRCYLRTNQEGVSGMHEEILRFIQTLEKYHFVNNAICERLGNEVEMLYANFSKKFSESEDFFGVLKDFFERLRGQIATKEAFKAKFSELSYQRSTTPLLLYIFDRFSNKGLSAAQRLEVFSLSSIYRKGEFNIEHWYAQSLVASDGVSLPEESINNVGNLLCINHQINSSLGNLAPKDKAKKLEEELAQNIQNHIYLRNFLDRYGEIGDGWSADVIKRRAEDLAEEAYSEIWAFEV